MASTSDTPRSETPAVDVLCHSEDLLGEGPLWDHRFGRLLWIDILRGLVHCWSAARGVNELLRMDALIGSVALAGESDLLLATSLGLMKWVASSSDTVLLANPISSQPVRFNDGRVDAAGRFWVGTMPSDPARYSEPLGELFRFDPDASIHEMERGLTISNGLDWSPDGRTFYLTDTMRRLIYAYDFDEVAGTIANRRIFVSADEAHGFPDGLIVDCDGHLWSACFAGGGICRYDAEGRFIEKVALPVSCPTAITFGGAGCSTAFITTSRYTLDPGHVEAEAGSLLTLSLPRRARSATVFGKGVSR